MEKFKVQHVIISLKEDGTPKHMSLHMPIDGKIRVHTLFPRTPMFEDIVEHLRTNSPIAVEGQLVQLEVPTYYALITPSTDEEAMSNERG